MGPPPCTAFKSLSLQIVPVDDLRRPTIRLRIEIGFQRVRQTEAAALNLVYVFACSVSDKAVELALYHLRLLLEKEKTLPTLGSVKITPPRIGARDTKTARASQPSDLPTQTQVPCGNSSSQRPGDRESTSLRPEEIEPD